MLRSMTGYGRGSCTRDGFTFSAELRSVNHRYADFSVRLPRELYGLEERIRRLLQESIKRGRVEVTLGMDEMPAGVRRVKVNYDLAADYHSSLQELRERLRISDDVSIEHLLQLPDLFKTGSAPLGEDQVWPALSGAVTEALDQLLDQRRTEGENLGKDILERCGRLEQFVNAAEERAAQAGEEYRARIEQKFQEMLAGHFEQNRLIMEAALLVERMGVDEELVRLKSHIQAFRSNLTGEEPAGRKLDFIAQEMFREVNTIGSKAGDYRLTDLVVEMKAELEKIREQIQNLE